MQPPSTTSLRAILRPSVFVCNTCQRRAGSSRSSQSRYVDPKKYHKPNALDKLHRKQKEDLRQEKQASVDRANSMSSPLFPIKTEITTASTASSIPRSTLSYTITRTPSNNLPIYQLAKAGGSKHLTQVRKLSGDLNALQSDIRSALGMEQFVIDVLGRKKENVAINWTTRQIIVRGWRGPEIKTWAETKGF